MARSFTQGARGETVTRGYTESLDSIVIELLRAARTEAPKLKVSLVAVGGYGRGEMCPYSDLDLWFLTQEDADRRVVQLAEKVLYPLWDLRLEVGHAVR